MNKRKIMLLAMSLVMVAILGFGSTLAYLTDTDHAVNVFVVGDIEIELIEEERVNIQDGSEGVQAFHDNKVLLPIVGSAQGEKETITASSGNVQVPTYEAARNWVDKIVNVKNTSVSGQPAYVRVLFAFPALLDDANSAAEMLMHWNHDGSEPAGTWTRVDNGCSVTLGGKAYNVYTYTYEPILAFDTVTVSPAITGVYIDSRVDATSNGDQITYTLKDSNGKIKSATFDKGTGPELYVLVQGVQAAGFDSASEGLEEAFGVVNATNAQTWFDEVYAAEHPAD